MVDGQDWDEDFEPPHRLVISVPGAEAGQPVTFVPEPGAGEMRREWAERVVVVSTSLARVLPLAAGDSVVERSMRVLVGGEPVLISSSYLPAGLTGDAQGWQHVEVGQLALAGWPARSTYLEDRWRMPTHAEAEVLGIERGLPVLAMARPYTVWAGEGVTVPAGVLVVARSDLVYVRHEATPTTA